MQVKVNHVDSQGPRRTKNCEDLDLEKDRNLFFTNDHFGSRCEERKTDDLAVTHYLPLRTTAQQDEDTGESSAQLPGGRPCVMTQRDCRPTRVVLLRCVFDFRVGAA